MLWLEDMITCLSTIMGVYAQTVLELKRFIRRNGAKLTSTIGATLKVGTGIAVAVDLLDVEEARAETR
jgi:hypothetical protein